MKKNLLFILALPLMLAGCTENEPQQPTTNDFETWLLSDNAEDLNGDRKINNEDFELYQAFKTWVLSEEAMDLNGDGKIDFKDYKISNGEAEGYEDWLKSDHVFDFDKDGEIKSSDYDIYLKVKDDIGTYKVTNFLNITNTTAVFDLGTSVYSPEVLQEVIENCRIEVKYNLSIAVTFNDSSEFKNSAEVKDIINKLVFNKISDSLIEIKSNFTYSGIQSTVNFYLTKKPFAEHSYAGSIEFVSPIGEEFAFSFTIEKL